MAEVNRAYELLSDGARRAAWDAAHPVQVPRPAPRPQAPGGAGAAARDRSRPAGDPTLEDALAFVLTFGKFRGRTLGYVAAREPGYIAWMVRTLRNRPDVARHARVVLAHLESSGWRDTPRPPRERDIDDGTGAGAQAGARAGMGAAAGAGAGAGTGAGARAASGARPTQPPSRPSSANRDHAGAIGLGLTALGGVAWFAGIPPETVSGLVFLVAFIGWPLWMVVQNHRHPLPRDPRTGSQAWRGAVGEVVFVAVLLAIGWAVLQSVLEGPQPGDIVCEVYDPRLGDCVVESVYEGE